MSSIDIQRYLADYPDPIRRWNIPLRTVQWWCQREEQPNGKRLRRKGGGRKPSIPAEAENRIADLIIKNAKVKRCVSNYSVRVQLGMAVGKSIASHGIARRFRKRHGFDHDVVKQSDQCLPGNNQPHFSCSQSGLRCGRQSKKQKKMQKEPNAII
jgi:hypothetical protein